jgi:hypothetical protein
MIPGIWQDNLGHYKQELSRKKQALINISSAIIQLYIPGHIKTAINWYKN